MSRYPNIIKCLLSAVIAVFAVAAACAQDKVVERSASRQPGWIGSVTADCFAASAEDATLDGAQNKCMDNIRQQIITSIASNITSNETYKSLQVTQNELVQVFENYSSDVNTVGARLPFITGIAITKAEDVYWEKHYVKKEKRYYYVYHILYPFPASERIKWTQEFLAQDKAKYDSYLALKEQIDKFTGIEFINEAIGELGALREYFFDSHRKGEMTQLQYKYNEQYGYITVEPLSESLGEVNYCLSINGRPVTTAKLPRLKSASATDLSVKREDNGTFTLTYNYEYCADEDDNSIEVSYLFGGKSVKRIFNFDVRENKIDVRPVGSVGINCVKVAGDSTVSALAFNIVLRSKYDNEFEVKEVVLSVPGFEEEIKVQPGRKFAGKGEHLLSFDFKLLGGAADVSAANRQYLLDAVITLLNTKTGAVTSRSVKLPYAVK